MRGKNWKGSAVPLAAVVTSLLLAPGCARFDARMLLKKGNSAYKAQKYEQAVKFYEEVPAGLPERLHAALNTGYAHLAQYRMGSKHPKDREHAQKAVEAFEEYLKLRPADTKDAKLPEPSKIEDSILVLLVDSERYDDAVARLQRSLEKNKDDPAVFRALASTYDKWSKPVVALQYFQKWAKAMNQSTPYQAIAAYCWNLSYRQGTTMDTLERNRWVDSGLEASDQALKLDPRAMEGLSFKNLLLRERAKLRVDPDQVALLLKEANALLEIRKKVKEEEEAKAKASGSTTPTPKPKGSTAS